MSLLSRLKSVFSGTSEPKSDRPPQESASSLPKVKKPVVQDAVTDQHYVRLTHKTNKVADGLVCDYLDGSGSQITALSDGVTIRQRLKLADCVALSELPDSLSVPSIILSGCTALQKLPSNMRVHFLDLRGCNAISALPEDLRIKGGILTLSGCTGLTALPDDLGEVAGLDLNGCRGISQLPSGLKVTSWIDITGTGIRTLPEGYASVGFRRGNEVISAEEALAG